MAQLGTITTLVHELTHVFTKSPNEGGYGHFDMALAAENAAKDLGIDIKSALQFDFPTPDKYKKGEIDLAYSHYFDRVLSYACRKVK